MIDTSRQDTEITTPIVRYRNLPVVVIAGRPNVGKSTLFNRLLHKRRAITDPTPGVTRDPVEAECLLPGASQPVLLVDTGGVTLERAPMNDLVSGRSVATMGKADLILFLVDATSLTPEDQELAARLRRHSDRTILVVNKADSPERDALGYGFARMGFSDLVAISAEHGRNIDELVDKMLPRLDFSRVVQETDAHEDVRVAILGKPNTGKSTLLNRLIGEQKSLVSEIAGTTRDVVEGSLTWKGRRVTVLDTAGIRRKKKVVEDVEYYSVNRAIRTIEDCDIVVLMIDAQEGLTDQDKKIAALATDKGRGLVFALNKWDRMPDVKNAFEASRDKLRYFFGQMSFVPVLPLSAKEGQGVPKLLDTLLALFDQLTRKIETAPLNRAVEGWVTEHPPPVGPHTRFKLRYAVQSGINPVKFLLFVSRPEAVNESYLSYLKNKIRSDLGFAQIPISLELRGSSSWKANRK
jgi:GTP-binding protein